MLVNSESVQKLAYENYSAARKVWEHIKDVFRKMRESVQPKSAEAKLLESRFDQMQVLWDQALEQAVENGKAAPRPKKNAARKGDGEKSGKNKPQFSIRRVNGLSYVQADRQVLFGTDPEAWGEQIETFIHKEIRKGNDVEIPTTSGEIIRITADTEGKASFRNDIRVGEGTRKMTDSEYETKLNAEAHIDELVTISTRGKKNKTDYKGIHGAKASKGFNYRISFFRDFDGRYYRMKISVMEGEQGKIAYNIGEIVERPFPNVNGSSANAALLKTGNDLSGDSIRESAEKSKREFAEEESGRMISAPTEMDGRGAETVDPSVGGADSSLSQRELEGNGGRGAERGVEDAAPYGGRGAERGVEDAAPYGVNGDGAERAQMSLRDDTSEDTEQETADRVRSYNQLKADNEALKRQVERLRNELKPTKEAKVRRSDAVKSAKKVLQGVQCAVTAQELADSIESMANYVLRTDAKSWDTDMLWRLANETARDIVTTAWEEADTGMDETHRIDRSGHFRMFYLDKSPVSSYKELTVYGSRQSI